MITYNDSSNSEYLNVAGSKYRVLIDGKSTDGKYSVVEMIIPPGSGPNPHSHSEIQESFFIVEGEVEFRTEKSKILARKGDFFSIPLEGNVHSFKNISNSETRLICTIVPAGLEEMFIKVSNAPKKEVKNIIESYGNKIYPIDFLD